jgi:hypothetical protein
MYPICITGAAHAIATGVKRSRYELAGDPMPANPMRGFAARITPT